MRWCLQEVLLDGSQRRSFRYRGLQVAFEIVVVGVARVVDVDVVVDVVVVCCCGCCGMWWLLWYVVVVVDDVRDDAVFDGDSGLDV